jgi:hypothetical protein
MHNKIAASISPPADLARVLEIDPHTLRPRSLQSDLEQRRRELTEQLSQVNGMLEEIARHE